MNLTLTKEDMKTLNLQAIIIDKGTQSRAEISEETVTDYAEAMRDGAEFPPITVFYDGVEYYLADGYHRLHAANRLGKASIQARVEWGTLRDAILFSLGANADHGLRRTNADKRRCIMTLLEDFEWQSLANTQIANYCRVSPQLVAAVKAEMSGGEKVSTVVTNTPKQAIKAAKKLANVVEAPLEEKPEMDEAVKELVADNQRLSDRLAVETMDASEEEKLAASETIAEMREQIRILEIENQSLKISRDTYQRENSELKKTVQSLQRKLKKEE